MALIEIIENDGTPIPQMYPPRLDLNQYPMGAVPGIGDQVKDHLKRNWLKYLLAGGFLGYRANKKYNNYQVKLNDAKLAQNALVKMQGLHNELKNNSNNYTPEEKKQMYAAYRNIAAQLMPTQAAVINNFGDKAEDFLNYMDSDNKAGGLSIARGIVNKQQTMANAAADKYQNSIVGGLLSKVGLGAKKFDINNNPLSSAINASDQLLATQAQNAQNNLGKEQAKNTPTPVESPVDVPPQQPTSSDNPSGIGEQTAQNSNINQQPTDQASGSDDSTVGSLPPNSTPDSGSSVTSEQRPVNEQPLPTLIDVFTDTSNTMHLPRKEDDPDAIWTLNRNDHSGSIDHVFGSGNRYNKEAHDTINSILQNYQMALRSGSDEEQNQFLMQARHAAGKLTPDQYDQLINQTTHNPDPDNISSHSLMYARQAANLGKGLLSTLSQQDRTKLYDNHHQSTEIQNRSTSVGTPPVEKQAATETPTSIETPPPPSRIDSSSAPSSINDSVASGIPFRPFSPTPEIRKRAGGLAKAKRLVQDIGSSSSTATENADLVYYIPSELQYIYELLNRSFIIEDEADDYVYKDLDSSKKEQKNNEEDNLNRQFSNMKLGKLLAIGGLAALGAGSIHQLKNAHQENSKMFSNAKDFTNSRKEQAKANLLDKFDVIDRIKKIKDEYTIKPINK